MEESPSCKQDKTPVKMTPQYKEVSPNRNIPHAVAMREYGSSRCLNQLASEFRIAAEEKLILKAHKETKCDLPDFTRSTYLMVFSPDGKKMASSHGNHNVYVTDVKTGKNLNTLSGHPRTPWCIAFHPSSNQILASGCLGGQVRVWDLHGGSELWTVEGQTSIASLAFHPSDHLLVIASYNEILFWDWSQPEPFAKCSTLNEKEKIRYVAFDYSGSKLVTGIEIPKPVVSQWDRVGPGPAASRLGGHTGPRPSGQRPGFGPVFSRPSQSSGSGAVSGSGLGLGSGLGNGLGTGLGTGLSGLGSGLGGTSSRRSMSPPTLSSSQSSSAVTTPTVHRVSSSQLEGRIRQNVQLLQLLLDARRNAQNETISPRRPMNGESNTLDSNNSTRSINLNETGSTRNIGTSNSASNQLRSFMSESFQERRHVNPHSTWRSESILRGFGGERLNSSNPVGIRNLAANVPLPSAPCDSNRDPSTASSSNDIAVDVSSNTNQLTLNQSDSSVGSSSQRRVTNRQSRFMHLGGSPSLGPSSTATSMSPNFRSQNFTATSSQVSFTNGDLDVSNQINNLSEDIRQIFYILSEHIDDMQHCSVCLPRMSSSRLSHIRQLWAELRDQIRSLQSSIWENTTLASNAWQRSSFEAITEMLSHLTHEEGNSNANRPASPSSFQRENQSTSTSLQSNISLSSSPTNSLSTELSHLSSRNSGFSARRSVQSPFDGLINSSASRCTPRSILRGNVHRRPHHAGRMLYLRCQNAARRHGTTAGILRSQRPSGRSSQSTETEESISQSSSSNSEDQSLVPGRHLPSQSSESSQPYQTSSASEFDQTSEAETRSDRANVHSPPRDSTASGTNGLQINGRSGFQQSPLLKYRYFWGRRRNVASRPFRSSTSVRSPPQRVTPPRFFGGRRSDFEITLDTTSPPQSQQQPSRNTRANSQSSIRTSDNMLMRIFRSLRRAASLSGHLNQSQPSLNNDQSQNVTALPVPLEPSVPLATPPDTSSNQQTSTSPEHSGDGQSSGLRLWTQYSGPDGDVLHIRLPQMERMDSAVRERLLRIRSSGTMNVVQNGVMTEELARNLLRLHVHQQYQELQLRQHQARLRVRFHNLNSLRLTGHTQRDFSRRVARCSLCGGSVYIRHPPFFLRVRATTPAATPATTSSTPTSTSDTTPVSASSANQQSQPQVAQSPPVWRRWVSPTSSGPTSQTSPSRSPTRSPSQSPTPSSSPSSTPLLSSRSPPLFRLETQTERWSLLDPPVTPPTPPPPPPQLSQHTPQPAHPPLQPPLMQSVQAPRMSSVLSPPQLLLGLGTSPLGPLPSPPSSASPSPPSPTLSSLSPLSPSSPPLHPPPPPPLPPMVSAPLLSQVSTQTNPRPFGGDTSSNPPGISGHRIEYSSSSSLFWQVPASHLRLHSQQAGGPQARSRSSEDQPTFESTAVRASPATDLHIDPANLPSTSTGICFSSMMRTPVLSNSSSSDSETEDLEPIIRTNTTLSSPVGKVTEQKEEKRSDRGNCEAGPSRAHSKESHKPNGRSDALKRKREDDRRTPPKHKFIDTQASSDSDNTDTESPRSKTCVRENHQKCQVNNFQQENETTNIKLNSQTGAASENEADLVTPSREAESVTPSQEAELGAPSQEAENAPRQEASQQLPEPTFTRQLEAITGRLDHLMFLQRNALDPSQRNRDGESHDNSPLRNTGEPSHTAQESSRSSDAINVTSRLLTRLTHTLSRQIQMVQQIRGQQNSCNDHQESPIRPGATNISAQTAMINNTRRRGRVLLRLMADSLSTFSSHNGLPVDFQGNPAFEHVQNMSSAFWLLQGLYILLDLALELTDLLLTHFVSSYESNDPEEASVEASIPRPCVCWTSNSSANQAQSSQQRIPVGSPHLWNPPSTQSGNNSTTTNSGRLNPLMIYETVNSQNRPSQPSSLNEATGSPSGGSLSPISSSPAPPPSSSSSSVLLSPSNLSPVPLVPSSLSPVPTSPALSSVSSVPPSFELPSVSIVPPSPAAISSVSPLSLVPPSPSPVLLSPSPPNSSSPSLTPASSSAASTPLTSSSQSSAIFTSQNIRPWLVNLHNVVASVRAPGSGRPPTPMEAHLRMRRRLQEEAASIVSRLPLMPIPPYTPLFNDSPAETVSGRISHTSRQSIEYLHQQIQIQQQERIQQAQQRQQRQQRLQQAQQQAQQQAVQQAARQLARQMHQLTEQQQQPPFYYEALDSVSTGVSRPGYMRLRTRLLPPPFLRQNQERPPISSDADMAAQQSLFFHYDYTRNIGHFVREPNFTGEEHRIHRIQLWDFSRGIIPDITKGDENLVVSECKIHNDASVDISSDGHLLVALLPTARPSGHPQILPTTPAQTIGVYSLVWESLGQLLYTTSIDQPAVSVALSPSSAYLLVGLATRRAMLMPNDQHALAQIFRLEGAKPGRPIGARGRLNLYRYIEPLSSAPVGINCIRWAPVSGQGIVYGTNNGTLVMLR
ncbi:uncharacterized protein LOC117642241 isoform X2 [Thrips palmi]|uniref:Uncharacterized protein LOC117642241 isoform X2 n=1 Tax=Thrips palmi TaxID=161013 RepID=A0A6P8Y8W4_THRPL|nr:uncharacterized protein LOC117642241 isoform X2 [Thrips palmi]